MRACANKLFDLEADLRRKANRENRKLSQEELHKLWILSPTISERVLGGFNARPDLVNWPTGIYVCGDEWHIGLVAIHQLPPTRETLFLRIFGRGRVQLEAIAELRALDESDPFRDSILELVADMLAILEVRRQQQNLEEEDREFIVQLSAIYTQRLEEATQQGRLQGREQGRLEERRQIVLNLLRSGLSIAQIAEVTGLSPEQIREAQNSNDNNSASGDRWV